MIGKFADPGKDLMLWIEVTDSAVHGNDRRRPANEKKEERITLSNLTMVRVRWKWR
jgi:hypothetical protein